MINEENAKKYCCEDISLIYGYDEAVADKDNMWEIHHTLGLAFSMEELKEKGLYYNQPAEYLMFVTKSQHMILHNIDEKRREKNSDAHKRENLSEETKRKMSEAKKGKTGEKNNRSKPVNQIEKNTGEIIKTWTCTMETQRQLGIKKQSISACCKGKRKSAGGYIWRYVNESGGD